tara:strand:- start:619 stop:1044 length:426 start_codon:yes stop_codon:yes gene_type:complete
MWRTLPFVLFISSPVFAVPVVPNFQTGSSVSRTESSTIITESIRTTNYSGFQYTVSGSGIEMEGSSITPPITTSNQTINGTTYTWTDLDLNQKPNWKQIDSGNGAFQFVETYTPSGVSSISDVTRTIESQSVTDTTTIFSQ